MEEKTMTLAQAVEKTFRQPDDESQLKQTFIAPYTPPLRITKEGAAPLLYFSAKLAMLFDRQKQRGDGYHLRAVLLCTGAYFISSRKIGLDQAT